MASKVNDIVSNIDYSAQDILYMLRDLPDACCIFQVVTDPFGTVKDMLFLFVNEKYASLVGSFPPAACSARCPSSGPGTRGRCARRACAPARR